MQMELLVVSVNPVVVCKLAPEKYIQIKLKTINAIQLSWADPEGGQGSGPPPPAEKSQIYRVS